MRWYEAKVLAAVPSGVDELGHEESRLEDTGRVILVRAAPRTVSKDMSDGNRFGYVDRTFMTRARADMLEGIKALKVLGETYGVVRVASMDGPFAIATRRVKP